MYFESIVTPMPVSLEEFQDFIRSLAEWIESCTSQEEEGHGYLAPLDKDPAKVYLHLFQDLSIDFSQKDIEDLTEIFGSEPLVNIQVGVSGRTGSSNLAQDVIRDVIHRFGGIHAYVSKDTE